jgi:hypothetical protein
MAQMKRQIQLYYISKNLEIIRYIFDNYIVILNIKNSEYHEKDNTIIEKWACVVSIQKKKTYIKQTVSALGWFKLCFFLFYNGAKVIGIL